MKVVVNKQDKMENRLKSQRSLTMRKKSYVHFVYQEELFYLERQAI